MAGDARRLERHGRAARLALQDRSHRRGSARERLCGGWSTGGVDRHHLRRRPETEETEETAETAARGARRTPWARPTDCGRFGDLEAWIASRRWKTAPGGWIVTGELEVWSFRVEVIPAGLRV